MNIEMITNELIKVLKKEKSILIEDHNLLIVLSEGRYRVHRPGI